VGKKKLAIAAVVAAGLGAVPAVALATAPTHATRHADPSIIQVCLTVTPKSLNLSLNGQPLFGPSEGVPTTCVGV
jgi:hypothetical protein